MDVPSLALSLHRHKPSLEGWELQPTRSRLRFDAAPFGFAHVTIDPTSTQPAASLNRNRICLCGREGGLTEDGLRELLALFDAQSIDRVFVWLSPGPDADQVGGWLEAMGLNKVAWTRYPVLALGEQPETVAPCAEIEISKASPDDIANAREQHGLAMMSGFEESTGAADAHHYLAYDAGRPIASAMLVRFEDIGYLTHASTNESDRRRGAQGALIARRIADARALGCRHIVSETLTMLQSSFANLQRSGFREVYEREVYERSRG
jgi:hypothetical protein